jgi:hypothetical protein
MIARASGADAVADVIARALCTGTVADATARNAIVSNR